MHGAPSELVRRAQRAALEEAKHAELSFSLAALFSNGSRQPQDHHLLIPTPATMPIPSQIALDDLPSKLLSSTFREGCIAEVRTLVALSFWVIACLVAILNVPFFTHYDPIIAIDGGCGPGR